MLSIGIIAFAADLGFITINTDIYKDSAGRLIFTVTEKGMDKGRYATIQSAISSIPVGTPITMVVIST